MFDFLKIGNAVKKLASELNEIRAGIEEKKRQIEDISYAPKHPEDILEDAMSILSSREEEYRELFRARVFNRLLEPPRQLGGREFRQEASLINLTMGGGEAQLLGLIGSERILAIFKEEIAKMQPGDYGPRRAERGPLLKRLQSDLANLQVTEQKLIADAQDAGLVIQ